MFMKIILFCSLLVFLFGCAIIEHKDQLLTLKKFGDDQAKQEQFIKRQESKFKLLLSDVEEGLLKKGDTKERVLSRYGEPVSIKEINGDSVVSEQLMYRHPEQFFGSEKVYLSFDKNQSLVEWLYAPAPEK